MNMSYSLTVEMYEKLPVASRRKFAMQSQKEVYDFLQIVINDADASRKNFENKLGKIHSMLTKTRLFNPHKSTVENLSDLCNEYNKIDAEEQQRKKDKANEMLAKKPTHSPTPLLKGDQMSVEIRTFFVRNVGRVECADPVDGITAPRFSTEIPIPINGSPEPVMTPVIIPVPTMPIFDAVRWIEENFTKELSDENSEFFKKIHAQVTAFFDAKKSKKLELILPTAAQTQAVA
jgi:hypothetical protein